MVVDRSAAGAAAAVGNHGAHDRERALPVGACLIASLVVTWAGLLGCAASHRAVAPHTRAASPPVSAAAIAAPPTESIAPSAVWVNVAPTPPAGCDVPELSLARSRCDRRMGADCEQVGHAIDAGQRGPVDPTVQRTCADWFYHRSCDLGFPTGCDALAVHAAAGVSGPAIDARFMTLVASYCERSGKEAWCLDLGTSYELGRHVARDEARAVSIYEKACARMSAEECVSQARRQQPLGEKILFNAGRGRLEAACSRSDAAACARLGALHEEGRDVPKDLAAAANLYRKACNGGFNSACTALAKVSFNPAAKARDVNSAALFDKACEAGDVEACEEYAALPALSGVDLFIAVARACRAGARRSCRRIADDPTLGSPE